jgi:hypothetical protein
MAVVSRELKPDQEPGRSTGDRRRTVDLAGVMLGLVGCAIAAMLWLVDARYTIDGALVLLNGLLGFLRIPVRFNLPPIWALYCALALIPAACSLIEWHKVPICFTQTSWRLATLGEALVWLLVFGFDALTTWMGLGVIDPESPRIVQEVAVTAWVKALLTAILAIGPEALLRSMVAVLRRSVRVRVGS